MELANNHWWTFLTSAIRLCSHTPNLQNVEISATEKSIGLYLQHVRWLLQTPFRLMGQLTETSATNLPCVSIHLPSILRYICSHIYFIDCVLFLFFGFMFQLELFITTTMDESSRDSELEWLQAKKKTRLEWVNIVNTRIIDWLQRNTLDSDFWSLSFIMQHLRFCSLFLKIILLYIKIPIIFCLESKILDIYFFTTCENIIKLVLIYDLLCLCFKINR